MGKKILLIDNQLQRRQELKAFLEKAGHEVLDKSSSHDAAWVFMMKNPPMDLVLLENELPQISGIELANVLEDELDLHLPIIGMSEKEEHRLLFDNFWLRSEPLENLSNLIEKLAAQN